MPEKNKDICRAAAECGNKSECGKNHSSVNLCKFHSLALNEKGEIFGWGGNLFNKLGQTNGLCGLPSKIYIKRKIVAISDGY